LVEAPVCIDRYKQLLNVLIGDSMPTNIRIADEEPQRALFFKDLPVVSVFLMIGLLQLAVAILCAGQWADFGEQALWIWP
jgi:hypothetical protein